MRCGVRGVACTAPKKPRALTLQHKQVAAAPALHAVHMGGCTWLTLPGSLHPAALLPLCHASLMATQANLKAYLMYGPCSSSSRLRKQPISRAGTSSLSRQRRA